MASSSGELARKLPVHGGSVQAGGGRASPAGRVHPLRANLERAKHGLRVGRLRESRRVCPFSGAGSRSDPVHRRSADQGSEWAAGPRREHLACEVHGWHVLVRPEQPVGFRPVGRASVSFQPPAGVQQAQGDVRFLPIDHRFLPATAGAAGGLGASKRGCVHQRDRIRPG